MGARTRETSRAIAKPLIDIAVCVNAAQAAFDLRLEVERAAKWEIEVLYGVFSLHNHQVSMPVNPRAAIEPENVNLAYAPTNPREFNTIAVRWPNCSNPYDHRLMILVRAWTRKRGSRRPTVLRSRDGLDLHRDEHLGLKHGD